MGLSRLRYEFLTSIHNAGITLNSNLQNLFVPIFDLHGIAESYFPTIRNPHPPQDLYNARMARATYFTNLYCKSNRLVLLFAHVCPITLSFSVFFLALPKSGEAVKVGLRKWTGSLTSSFRLFVVRIWTPWMLECAQNKSGWQWTSLERWRFVGFCLSRRNNARIGRRSATDGFWMISFNSFQQEVVPATVIIYFPARPRMFGSLQTAIATSELISVQSKVWWNWLVGPFKDLTRLYYPINIYFIYL